MYSDVNESVALIFSTVVRSNLLFDLKLSILFLHNLHFILQYVNSFGLVISIKIAVKKPWRD